MTRTIRWFLGLLGALVIIIGVVAWDANRRAWAAFEKHEKRVARGIADLRARHSAAPLHTDDPLAHLGSLVKPELHLMREMMARRREGEFFPYEGGWTYRDLWNPLLDLIPDDPDPLHGSTIVALLGAAQDLLIAGGVEDAMARFSIELAALQSWRATLAGHSLTPSEAHGLITKLESITASRPPVRDALLGEHLLECRTILKILRETQDPQGYLHRGPGWASLFSWKMLLVQILNERTEEFRALESIQEGTGQEYADAVRDAEKQSQGRRRFSTMSFFTSSEFCVRCDALVQEELARARVATAIAGFEAQHGRPPASILQLVPEWLPRVPRSLYTGALLEVKDRRVVSLNDGLEPDYIRRRTWLIWTVKQKGS